jgi:hypothetical protein
MTLPTLALTLCILGQSGEVSSSDQPSRGSGIAMTAAGGGAVMIGFVALIASVPLWLDGLDLLPGSTPGMSASDKADIAIAGTLTTLACAALIAGGILLPMGIKRLINSSSSASRQVEWLPMFAYNGHAGVGGMLVRF